MKNMGSSQELMAAIRAGDPDRTRAVLASGGVDVNAEVNGAIPIVEAVRSGGRCVEPLLAAGADVNRQDAQHTTALFLASSQRLPRTVRALLDSGADPSISPHSATSPLMAAVMARSAAALETARMLIAAGADANFQARALSGRLNSTVLMTACRAANREGVELLLRAGADVRTTGSFGSALVAAVEGGDVEIVRMVVAAGADPAYRVPADSGKREFAGKTALEIAQKKRAKVITALLQGADAVVAPVSPRHVTVVDAWKRLEEVLTKVDPEAYASLRPGATKEQIRAAERAFGQTLTAEARECFSIHDGQEEGAAIADAEDPLDEAYRILPLEEAVAQWRIWADLVKRGEFAARASMPDRGVRPDWYNLGWVPLTSNGAGDHHCLDLSPADGGTRGQVIAVYHAEAKRTKVADSLQEWLVGIGDGLSQEDG